MPEVLEVMPDWEAIRKVGFGVYWVAVTSGKRLGGGIEGNKEDAAKEWNGGKKLGGENEVCRGTWRGEWSWNERGG